MNNIEYSLAQIYKKHLGKNLSPDWMGLDILMPLIQIIQNDGASFIIKYDGARNIDNDDNGSYTFLIINGPLGSQHIKTDADSFESGASYVLNKYFNLFGKNRYEN